LVPGPVIHCLLTETVLVCSTLTRLRVGDRSRRQPESGAANEVEGSSLRQSAAPDTLKSSCAHVIPELAEPKAGWHLSHSKSTCRLHEGVLICGHGGIACCSAAWTPQGNHPTLTLHHAAIIVCLHVTLVGEWVAVAFIRNLAGMVRAATVHSSEGIDHTLHRYAARARNTTLPASAPSRPRSILVSLRW